MQLRVCVGVILYGLAVLGLVATGIWFTWPQPLVWPLDKLDKLAVLVNYIYTVATVLLLFVALGAAVFAMIQALDVAKSRKLTAVSALYNDYKTDAMRDAIRAVWTTPTDGLRSDDGDKRRRLVSDYWNWVGWIVREDLVDFRLISSRFQDAITIWEKLRPVELQIRREIEKREHPSATEAEIERAATEHVDNQPAAHLYRVWKQHTACLSR